MITLQKILVPTDFSDLSQQALEFALALADGFRAKLYLMHVWELPMTGSLLPPEPYPETVLTEEQKSGEEHLAKVTNELKASGFDVEPVFVFGKPYMEIVKAAAGLDVAGAGSAIFSWVPSLRKWCALPRVHGEAATAGCQAGCLICESKEVPAVEATASDRLPSPATPTPVGQARRPSHWT